MCLAMRKLALAADDAAAARCELDLSLVGLVMKYRNLPPCLLQDGKLPSVLLIRPLKLTSESYICGPLLFGKIGPPCSFSRSSLTVPVIGSVGLSPLGVLSLGRPPLVLPLHRGWCGRFILLVNLPLIWDFRLIFNRFPQLWF